MSTLTDRYVHATTRSVPEKRRTEISRELRALIEEMVTDRTDADVSEEDAERQVLTELGRPEALAARYSAYPTHLIGPEIYPIWRRLLLTLLSWVPAVVAALAVLGNLIDNAGIGNAIADGTKAGLGTALAVVCGTTAVFAAIERWGGKDSLPQWEVDSLPDVPAHRQVSLSDAVASVVLIAMVGAALVLQHFRSWVEGSDGADIPVLDPDLWSFWLPGLLAILAVCVVVEVAKYRVGHFSWPIVGWTAATSVAFGATVAYLALTDALLNPAFVSHVGMSGTQVDTTNAIIAASAIIIELWTIVDAIGKRRQTRPEVALSAR